MDTLLAAANALARHDRTADCRPMTPAEEDNYYRRHTLNVIVPAWMVSVLALLHPSHRNSPERIRVARHA